MSCPHGEISEEYSSGHAQKWEVNHLQKLESYSSYLIFYSLSNQEVFQKKYAKSQIKSKNKKKKHPRNSQLQGLHTAKRYVDIYDSPLPPSELNIH